MHLTTLLFSLSTIPSLIQAIPKPLQPYHKLSKRAYYAGYLSRTTPYRTFAGHAPVCWNADGSPCDFGPCYLDSTLEDHIYIDCSSILLCSYQMYQGPACPEDHARDNSAEVCQQSDDEVIDTIAEKTGYSREVAAEKFRILDENAAKGLTLDQVCPDGTDKFKFPIKPASTPTLAPVIAPVTEEEKKTEVLPVPDPVKEEPKKETTDTPSLVAPAPSQESEEPKKEEPKKEPKVVQPVVDEPKKEEPKKEEPEKGDTVLVDPIVEEPKKEEPKIETPKKHSEIDSTTTIYHKVTSTRYFTPGASPSPTSTSTITVTPEPTEEPEPNYEGPGYGRRRRKGGRKNAQRPCYWNAGCEGLEEFSNTVAK